MTKMMVMVVMVVMVEMEEEVMMMIMEEEEEVDGEIIEVEIMMMDMVEEVVTDGDIPLAWPSPPHTRSRRNGAWWATSERNAGRLKKVKSRSESRNQMCEKRQQAAAGRCAGMKHRN